MKQCSSNWNIIIKTCPYIYLYIQQTLGIIQSGTTCIPSQCILNFLMWSRSESHWLKIEIISPLRGEKKKKNHMSCLSLVICNLCKIRLRIVKFQWISQQPLVGLTQKPLIQLYGYLWMIIKLGINVCTYQKASSAFF